MYAHNIQITNVENGEYVDHPILLIKGNVVKLCDLETEVVPFVDGEQLEVSAPVGRRGEFKLLLDLRTCSTDQQNLELMLVYGSSQRSLIINKSSDANNCYRLQPLLIVCHGEDTNGENPVDSAEAVCQLIDLNLLLVQSLYAEKLRESGFGRITFTLNGKCEIFRSSLTCQEAWNSTENELWHIFGKEILNSKLAENNKLKFIAFIGCTKYDGDAVAASGDFSYANIRRHLKAHAALGCGGLALFGSAYFYAWPNVFSDILASFQNESRIDMNNFPDDSNYRRTYAGVYATSLGAVCHELGHIFDLGHTSEGVMGNGFDYLNRVFIVDTLTEHLPERQVRVKDLEILPTAQLAVPHITKFRPGRGSSFLKRYHEQKNGGDGFFFTRNCAVILAHHLWIRKGAVEPITAQPYFDAATQTVVCVKEDALKLVEIRCKTNSMVDLFYEISARNAADDKLVCHRFPLPECAKKMNNTHYIFVITARGWTSSFYFADKEP